jgi:hypothetical protein
MTSMTFQDLFTAFSGDPQVDTVCQLSAGEQQIIPAVIAEIDFALVATAMTASLVTAKALLKPVSPVLSTCGYLPPDPALSSAEALRVTDLALPVLFAAALRDFHTGAVAAKLATAAFEARDLQSAASQGKGWMRLSAQWRQVAASGVTAGDEAHRLAMTIEGGCFAHWPELRQLLVLVRDGETPSISITGELLFPNWADRRSASRKVLNMPVWQCFGEERRPVTLADISHTGFGLTDCRNLSAGSAVAVSLPSGRLLSGVAMWARDGRAGVRFREPLTRNDVLLT